MARTVSVVIPARHEEDSIVPLLDRLGEVAAGLGGYAFEVLVVVDSPDDPTGPAARSRGATVLVNERLRGKGNALYHGFRNATGEYIVILDADGSHDAAEIGLFLAALEGGAGLVIGSRVMGGSEDHDVIRLFGNALFTLLFDVLFGTSIMDPLNGYKAFVPGVVTGYRPKTKGFDVEIEIVAQAITKGHRLAEVPSHESRRAGGRMKSHAIRDGFLILVACLREGLRYRLGRLFGTARPARSA